MVNQKRRDNIYWMFLEVYNIRTEWFMNYFFKVLLHLLDEVPLITFLKI